MRIRLDLLPNARIRLAEPRRAATAHARNRRRQESRAVRGHSHSRPLTPPLGINRVASGERRLVDRGTHIEIRALRAPLIEGLEQPYARGCVMPLPRDVVIPIAL